MRSRPISLLYTPDGNARYYSSGAFRYGFGFRLSPLINPHILGTDAYLIPGIFPVRAVIHSRKREDRTLWIRDSGWNDIPDGFDSVDLDAPGIHGGLSNLIDNIPNLNAAPAIHYQVDIADSPGEKVNTPFGYSNGVLLLNGNVAIPEAALPGNGAPEAQRESDFYGIAQAGFGYFFYVFQQYRTLKLCLSSTTGTQKVQLWQSVASGGQYALAEVIDPANWLQVGVGAYNLVLNRDCLYANEWLSITSDVAGVTLDFGSVTYVDN